MGRCRETCYEITDEGEKIKIPGCHKQLGITFENWCDEFDSENCSKLMTHWS